MQKRLIVLMLCAVLVSATAVTSVVVAKQAPTTVAPQARSLGDHIANFLRISNFYILKISNTVLRSLGIHLMPGATVYPGTIQRAYSSYPDYTLTYSDAYETFTVYLPANQITGGTLPNPISNPVAVDYVYNIDAYHYTLSFSYHGVAYSAHYTTTTHPPYLSIDAKHCNYVVSFQFDKVYGTVYINTWDAAKNAYVKTPAGGVAIAAYVKETDPDAWNYGDYYRWGTTTSGSNGRFDMSHGNSYVDWDTGYLTYSLTGYPAAQKTGIPYSFECNNY